MLEKLIILCAALLLAGCYATDHKEAAFIFQDAVERTEAVMGDDVPKDGAVSLKCDSFNVATCPDRILADDVMTPRITQPMLIHSAVLRRMSLIYEFPVYNLPNDFHGCVLANVTNNRERKKLKSAGEIKEETILASIAKVNARHLLPLKKCWSDSYRPNNYQYRGMQAGRLGSKIIQMNDVEWEDEDVNY